MGYYTRHTMAARGTNLTPERVEEINQWLKDKDLIRYAFEEGTWNSGAANFMEGDWECYGECKWYEHHEDMTALSQAFPDITFRVEGEGEDRYDNWVEYYLNGDCEHCVTVVEFEEPTRIKW